MSEPASTQAWPDDVFVPPGFEFGKLSAPDPGFPPSAHPSGPLPGPIPGQPSGRRADGPGAGRAAGSEWAGLLRSLLPQPARRRWAREFVNGLEFHGWGIRVAIPILAMVVFGVAVVVIAGANSGHAGPAPSAASLGFPPATLAGNDFTAAGSGRGITQTLGRVASVGHEIVAVGSQAGTRIPRAQFFVSGDDGRTWKLGAVRDAAGGVPPPGHGAIFVAGAQGAWVALGPGSIWTSPDGRTWTLAPGNGMPLRPGDRINAVARTAHGFIAVGASRPGGQAARSTPLIFLSANGTSWDRLDAARLRLAAGNGHALDITSVAAAGQLILISGDAVTSNPKRTATVQAGVAWLSADGGATWAPVSGAATGHGARPQVVGVAAVGHRGQAAGRRRLLLAERPGLDVPRDPRRGGRVYRPDGQRRSGRRGRHG